MINTFELHEALSSWKEYSPGEGAHFDDGTLYNLTAAGAIADAEPELLRHLSRCPTCLAEWAEWRKARSLAEEDEAAPAAPLLAYGFLQAAASVLHDGLSMQSQCGSYRLDLLPKVDDGLTTLIVFEVLSAEEALENALVTIHDRFGKKLLEGRLRDGRLARPIYNPDQFDLSTWTVSIMTDTTSTRK